MEVTQIIMEKMTNNILKRYGCPRRMGEMAQAKMTWWPEARKRRGRPEAKWVREVERVIKQKNLTLEDAVNWKIWRKAPENQ